MKTAKNKKYYKNRVHTLVSRRTQNPQATEIQGSYGDSLNFHSIILNMT
jgi:hypothetical protein